MALQILSDLHLENPSAYDLFEITPKAPYLALLGDIGVVKDAGFFHFIAVQLPKFEIVFLLLGNHEPYHSSWTTVKEQINQFSHSQKTAGKLILLDQTRFDISSDLSILGCTLYSQVDTLHEERVSFGLNDFYPIDGWTVADHNAAHQVDLTWLNSQVAQIIQSEPRRKIVVLTHHSPVTRDERAVDPRHAGSPLSSGFATDLSKEICWTHPQVRLWAFGHTHYNVRFMDGGTGKQVVSNQRGYYFAQAKGFDPEMVVDV
ncbi:uncharacterized protein PFLUO_LOCUS1041 [Penicillium psychrofluorescens]|uniref:uncharacterized protein n=1 Tax=Penicillium psychrofluorescens TaxID=3158075 RepID=UPI003CCD373A